MFSPSTPEDEKAIPKTLAEIHAQVINILPSKWVEESDVYNILKELGYKIFQQEFISEDENKKGEKQHSYLLKYFLKINL